MDLFVLKTWLLAKFNKDEAGASMVEYAFLVGLIAIVAIVAVRFLGTAVSSRFDSAGQSLNG